jgi:hypothetical protein
MYVWLWRHLPGNGWLRSLQCLALFAIVTVLLFFVVFPKVEPHLPFGNVTVEPRQTVVTDTPTPGTPAPSAATPSSPATDLPGEG